MIYIIVFILVTIGIIAGLVLRPAFTKEKGGKIIAFLGFFILPFLALGIGTMLHLEHSKTTDFCLSCHVMEPYGESLYIDDSDDLPASYFQNNRIPRESACYACHATYTMFGGVQAKLRGLKHVYINYLGKIPEEIELYSPFENRECLHCHDGARSFVENEMHVDILADLRVNAVSCIDCHNLTHNTAELESFNFWQRKE